MTEQTRLAGPRRSVRALPVVRRSWSAAAGAVLMVVAAAPFASAAPALSTVPATAPSGIALVAAPEGSGSATAPVSLAEDVTWAVDPATAEGPDGRAWVELELDPGQTVTDHLAVQNLGKQQVTFALGAADGYFTDKGRFSMLTSAEPSVAAGTWVDVQDSVTVAPGAIAVVPFSVTVPDNATPGDHAAGIAASVSMVDGAGGAMTVESRVGFRVMTRVTGELAPALTIGTVTGDYDMTWNPVAPGSMDVEVSLAKTGNVALTVDPVASAGGARATLLVPDGSPTVELLPGDERVVTARIPDVWPMGPISTEVTARAVVQGTEQAIPVVTAAVTTWAMPWSQLIVLGGLVLLVLALKSGRRRRVERLQDLLDQARDEGRAQATADSASPAPAVPSRS